MTNTQIIGFLVVLINMFAVAPLVGVYAATKRSPMLLIAGLVAMSLINFLAFALLRS